ncbi:MAG: peptidoglycan-binding protein [Actinomycetota bacterium]
MTGWVAGSQIVSPAEAAARTAAPEPSPILVPAEDRILSADVVTRGTARFGSPQTLRIAPTALKRDLGVIARVPLIGTELKEGDVIATASGRPLFLLTGEQPVYRDLGPGLVGEDVRQLQESLNRLGFYEGQIDGIYADETEAAVAAWYEAAGFTPFSTTEGQLAAIRALEKELVVARIDLLTTQETMTSSEQALASARSASAVANAALQRGAGAEAAARAEADAANKAASGQFAAAQATLDSLLRQPPLVGATPAEVAAAQAELAAAQTGVSTAQANVAAVKLAGEKLIADSTLGSATSSADLQSADAAMRAAQSALSLSGQTINQRRALISLIAEDLDLVRRRAGIQVPADEMMFLLSAPVRVAEVAVARSEQLTGPIMTVTDSVVLVDGSLPLEVASLVVVGMDVLIDEADLGIEAKGKVTRVAEVPGTNGVDGFHIYFETTVDDAPPTLVGASVRLTVPVESTGTNVLVVPLNALFLAADGSSQVQLQKNGVLQVVKVEPGLSADGFVQVTPTTQGTLKAGDLVLIGFEEAIPVAGG